MALTKALMMDDDDCERILFVHLFAVELNAFRPLG